MSLRLGILFSLAASSVYGQAVTSLNGTVVDPTGAAIPAAALTLTNIENNASRETASDGLGRYAFPGLAPGTYRLKATKQGFADVSIQNLRLLVNTPATVNVTFEKVGSVSQTIEVAAESIQLNTVDATLGNSFGTKQVTQLPLEGRRVDRLLSLQGGVSYIGDPDTVNGGSSAAVDRNGVVNGGRSDQSNIMLDGVDINNQQTRDPFQGALRVTLDSVQEFRVTTSNANADASRGSGAQISLVTRSGTNRMHGALYEYLRNKAANANTFFNNLTLDANGKALPTPKLNRNIFGGRIGGPIRKDKLFYFFNFEGQQDRLEQSVIRTVPREHLKQGNVRYLNVNRQTVELTPQQLLGVVADAGSLSQNALNVLRSFPAANDFTAGDGINTAGFRFNAPLARRYYTYVGKIDYSINDKHKVFVRGQLQNDVENFPPQFPGLAPNEKDLNNSKGLGLGWDAVLTPSFFSTTRYGFTRQGIETSGTQTYPLVTFRGMSSPISDVTSFRRISPVHHLAQDFTNIRGSHTFQFGGSYRMYTNDRLNFASSYFAGGINSSWLLQSGNILSASLAAATVPDDQRILAQARTSFHDATAAVLGLVTQVTSRYNYLPNPDGTARAQAPGEGVPRKFRGEESEIYFQDTWKIRRNLTITPGVRFMYWPAIYEVNGVQTSPSIPLSEWFDRRVAAAGAGQSGSAAIPRVLFNLANATGGRPLYDNLHNWSPRMALAFTPDGKGGLSKLLFGEGKTVIRAGFGMYYDVFGAGLIRSYDASSLGLSTSANNSSGRLTVAQTPRYVSPTSIPQSLVTPPPPAQFPVEQPDIFQITNSLDDRLRAPYVMRWNLSFSRDFHNGWIVSAAYVASEGRRTLTSEDLATPLNIRDPQSGVDYFAAAKQFASLIRANTAVRNVQPIPYWENMFPQLAKGGQTATQVAYSVYQDNYPDGTAALESLDRFGSPGTSKLGKFAFFSPQYSFLRALRSVGFSSYHSMQWGLRKRFGNGDQIDFNWTWAHSIDMGSVTENNASTTDGLRGIIINPYNRREMRGSSDFDQRHLFNAAYVYNLPIGKGHKFGSGMSRLADMVVGGWQLGGIYRQSSGLPTSVGHGRTWPTNYNITGWATQTAAFADGTNKNAPAPSGGRSGPNVFQDPATAFKAFGFTDPGEIGNRNNVRGDGIFSIDMNLAKSFSLPWEDHKIQFRWEVFNVTNSVRFDPLNINLTLGSPSAFGKYLGTLGGPRVMQFSLRYDF
ncbi:MAG: carboxypeptidase-like regulatory domain-containing protein [Bryobacteraceae bacterium]